VKCVTRKEVGLTDPILGIREPANLRYDLINLFGVDHGQLHLNEYIPEICLSNVSCIQYGGCGLSPVDNLHIINRMDTDDPAVHLAGADACCGHSKPVVVCEKHFGLVACRRDNSAIDLGSSLEKRSHILL